jgi:hypothetical protein
MQPLGEVGDRRRIRRQPDHGFEEQPGGGWGLGQRIEDRGLDPGHGAGCRLSHNLAQPAPARRGSYIHDLPDTRSAQPEQHLCSARVVL